MSLSRRTFVKTVAASTLAFAPMIKPPNIFADENSSKPKTNIADALKYPRTKFSMPGLFPGKVAQITDKNSSHELKINYEIVSAMLEKAMMALTETESVAKAWQMFVAPGEKIGIKVNPVAGRQLSTSIEIVKAVIEQLVMSGIDKQNIIIWDRREFQLHEAGFNKENFPDIEITGTEQQDEAGSFRDAEGQLYSDKMLDKEWFYRADVEGKYDENTLPYMCNEGFYSYFTKICTQKVDKIINIPILKNAGSSITLALKNLAYGAVTNTARLHKQLWAETCAEVPAFPPLRDKTVLNIADGIIGCFNGGPGYNPQFVTEFHTLLVATDPVALDRVGYDIILEKRIKEKIQEKESPNAVKFLELAEKLQLGIADKKKINILKF